ncbi:MAG: hypothetical protein ACQEP3_02810 [Patescibacteria group bacterium]
MKVKLQFLTLVLLGLFLSGSCLAQGPVSGSYSTDRPGSYNIDVSDYTYIEIDLEGGGGGATHDTGGGTSHGTVGRNGGGIFGLTLDVYDFDNITVYVGQGGGGNASGGYGFCDGGDGGTGRTGGLFNNAFGGGGGGGSSAIVADGSTVLAITGGGGGGGLWKHSTGWRNYRATGGGGGCGGEAGYTTTGQVRLGEDGEVTMGYDYPGGDGVVRHESSGSINWGSCGGAYWNSDYRVGRLTYGNCSGEDGGSTDSDHGEDGSVVIRLLEPQPATFDLEPRENSYFWSPDGIEEEEESSVRVTVRNTGDVYGCQDIIYEIPGVGSDSEEVCLDRGESIYWGPTLTVMPAYGDAGEHTGTVSSADDSFEVDLKILARPEILDTEVDDLTGCGDSTPDIVLYWDYHDRNTPFLNQDRFHIIIRDIDNGIDYERELSGQADTFYVDDHFDLNFNSDHEWEIRVRNEEGLWSDWYQGDPFTTQVRYSNVDFQYAPASPFSEEVVHFQDKSEVFSGSLETVNRRAWDLGSGATPERYKEGSGDEFIKVNASYPDSGTREVILEITDNLDRTCSVSKNLRVRSELPEWQEIDPF